MITWGDTISIILEMFDSIKQQELAQLMRVSESSLSKIKNGKQKGNFNSDAVFRAVFDPSNSKSPAKDKPPFLLSELKDIIDKPDYQEVRETMDDCWGETDYRTFVIRLLERTRNKTQDDGADAPKEVHTLSPEISLLGAESSTAVSDMGKRSIQSLLLPHRDKCCFYCIHWSGNTETFGAYMNAAYGRCQKYNRDNQLSSAAACVDYKANLIVIDQMGFCGVNTEGLI